MYALSGHNGEIRGFADWGSFANETLMSVGADGMVRTWPIGELNQRVQKRDELVVG
jgi:hypothetical protein